MGKKQIEIAEKQFRSLSFDIREAKADEENQTIEFSFSSEVPYRRWYGFEILSHDDGAMEMDRLDAAAPLLFNHDWDKHLGVVEKAWISEDKRGYVRVKFSKSALGQEKFQDVKDGILKGVSFGYMVKDAKLVKESEDGDEWLITKYQPYEITLCTVPADYSVGIGRSNEKPNEKTITFGFAPEESSNQIPKNEIETNKPAVRAAFPGGNMEDHDKAVAAEKLRIKTITLLGEKFKKPDLAKSLIDGDKTIDQARAAFLEEVGSEQKPITGNEAVVGLNEKEIKQYSILRAIRAMMDPNNKKFQEEAAFEREVSIAAAQKGGKDARGFMIPVDILRSHLFVDAMMKRDLVVGTSSAGGNLVATNLLAGSFIDILRKKSALQRAGAQVLNGLVGNIAIPRQTGKATAYWIGEGGAPTESAASFDQVTMSPKTVGAYVDYSRKLMLQSSIDVEAFVRNDLAIVLALEIDRVGLYGSGSSNQPQGIKLLDGINTEDFANNAPTYAEIVSMESKVAADDADVDGMKYLTNASMRGSFKTTEKATGTGQFIWEQGGTVNGYGAVISNQVESGDVFFGNFNDLIMGFWSGLDLLADPFTGSKEGNIRIVAHQDVDVAGRHPESFCRGNNTL